MNVPADEAEEVFGGAEVVAVESLGEPTVAATAGVWRIRTADDTAILKVVCHASERHERWPSSEIESDPYYWRREPLAYSSGLLDSLGGDLRAPRCRLCRKRTDATIALWLDDAGSQPDWTVERFRLVARDLGRMRVGLRPTRPGNPGSAAAGSTGISTCGHRGSTTTAAGRTRPRWSGSGLGGRRSWRGSTRRSRRSATSTCTRETSSAVARRS